MRTTVTLDRDLERMLRETAVRTRRPFKKVLNDTLRSALEGQAKMEAEPFVVNARPMCLRSGLDPAGFNRLADNLEAEAFLETTRKLMERKR
jgi:hypothetical protein